MSEPFKKAMNNISDTCECRDAAPRVAGLLRVPAAAQFSWLRLRAHSCVRAVSIGRSETGVQREARGGHPGQWDVCDGGVRAAVCHRQEGGGDPKRVLLVPLDADLRVVWDSHRYTLPAGQALAFNLAASCGRAGAHARHPPRPLGAPSHAHAPARLPLSVPCLPLALVHCRTRYVGTVRCRTASRHRTLSSCGVAHSTMP